MGELQNSNTSAREVGGMAGGKRGDDPFIFTLALKPVPQAVVHARETVAFALEHWGFGDDCVYSGKLVVGE